MGLIQRRTSGGSIEEVSIISKGVNIEGTFVSQGSVRIDGTVNGDIFVTGNLTLGETSEVHGDVRAENLTLSGRVTGSVSVAEKLVLEAKSYLKGDLVARILVVEPGAFFDGKCTMDETETTSEELVSE
ncbi:MAG TPA: polymer-forming cytoskeletal protein [Ignavibacteriales bacterium]|nr:polymer-forming cytoskeletal protein [Ignavibacteriales bacterium]